MSESFVSIMGYIVSFIDGIFAEASIVLLLLGFIFFLLGAVILVASLYIKFTARHVDGNVIGAIKDTRIKEKTRDGKVEKETKINYFAVFEYLRSDGTLHKEKSSNGGNGVLKYKTGEAVKLLVIPQDEFDDVYDENDKSPYIMGSILFLLGVFMIERATSLYASLSLGAFSLSVIIVSFSIRMMLGRKKKKKKLSVKQKHYKYFELDEIRPVEELALEEEDRR